MANEGEPSPASVDEEACDRHLHHHHHHLQQHQEQQHLVHAPVQQAAFDEDPTEAAAARAAAAVCLQESQLPQQQLLDELADGIQQQHHHLQQHHQQSVVAEAATVATNAAASPEHIEGKKARAQQQVWKEHEVEVLQQGVSKYGRNWKAILEDVEFAPTLGGRSPGSLKLKWYKMTKEHEEKINSATAWTQPGHQMSMDAMPFGRSWIDALSAPEPGENGSFEPWHPEELHAMREGVARYGLNFDAIVNDPNVAQLLAKRSPVELQAAWAQMQDVPKNWGQAGMRPEGGARLAQQGGEMLGLEGGGSASMRSWGRKETDALIKGFEVYGTDWKAILQDPRFRPHLAQRTCHSLKSKWARMMKKRKRDSNSEHMMDPMSTMHNSQGQMPMRYLDTPSVDDGTGIGSDPFGYVSQQQQQQHAAPNASVPEGLPKVGASIEDYDRSINEYTRQIGTQSANPILYNHRGVVYYAKGLVDNALDDFSTAIALDQSYADAYCNRGMAFNAKGEFDLAIMDCTTAIDINPTSSSATNAFLTRALTHYNKGMLEQCIFDCDATLALRPRCVSALVTRGLTVLALAKEGHRSDEDTQRNYVLALTDFKEAMQVDPNNQQARIWYDEARMLLHERQKQAGNLLHQYAPQQPLQQQQQQQQQQQHMNSFTSSMASLGGSMFDGYGGPAPMLPNLDDDSSMSLYRQQSQSLQQHMPVVATIEEFAAQQQQQAEADAEGVQQQQQMQQQMQQQHQEALCHSKDLGAGGVDTLPLASSATTMVASHFMH